MENKLGRRRLSEALSSIETERTGNNAFVGESDIAKRIKAIIVDKLGVNESKVVTSARFMNDLGADSLDTVELIMEFEKEFGINIPDDQAEKIATVGDAISYVESYC